MLCFSVKWLFKETSIEISQNKERPVPVTNQNLYNISKQNSDDNLTTLWHLVIMVKNFFTQQFFFREVTTWPTHKCLITIAHCVWRQKPMAGLFGCYSMLVVLYMWTYNRMDPKGKCDDLYQEGTAQWNMSALRDTRYRFALPHNRNKAPPAVGVLGKYVLARSTNTGHVHITCDYGRWTTMTATVCSQGVP